MMRAATLSLHDRLIARDAAVFIAQRNSTPVTKTMRAIEGCWAEDLAGHRFMDFHGNSCHAIGYRHPRLIGALKAQLDELPFTTRGFTNEVAVTLAERLAALWPYGPARILFGTSGADAIEMALKLAFIATGRRQTLAFRDAWHGAALGALWVGGRSAEREGFPAFEGCWHIPGYWADAGAEACRDQIRDLLLGRGGFACLLAEPLRAAGRTPPAWFWPEVGELCRKSGTLLIFDEIPKGLARTGKLFASQHFGVSPDITVIGKSLGGAVVPLSAVIAREDLDRAGHLAIGHYTHQKNPFLACAGMTVLDIIEDEGLCEMAVKKGAFLSRELAVLAARTPILRSVRNIGLLVEVEPNCPELAESLAETCFKRGLYVELSGTHAIGLAPPLTITDDELTLGVAIIRDAIGLCTGTRIA